MLMHLLSNISSNWMNSNVKHLHIRGVDQCTVSLVGDQHECPSLTSVCPLAMSGFTRPMDPWVYKTLQGKGSRGGQPAWHIVRIGIQGRLRKREPRDLSNGKEREQHWFVAAPLKGASNAF